MRAAWGQRAQGLALAWRERAGSRMVESVATYPGWRIIGSEHIASDSRKVYLAGGSGSC